MRGVLQAREGLGGDPADGPDTSRAGAPAGAPVRGA